jgi:hypothetical protein
MIRKLSQTYVPKRKKTTKAKPTVDTVSQSLLLGVGRVVSATVNTKAY